MRIGEAYFEAYFKSYLLKLSSRIEMVIKRMRWKVIYCGMKGKSIKIETYALESQMTAPPIN